MAATGSLRSLLLAGLSTALLGLISTASTAAEGGSTALPSTSPHVGEPLQPSNADQKALSDHLRRSGALFYGAWWCPACFQQKNLFGQEAGNRLPYVECDKTDPGRARCRAAGIRAYPTWQMQGKPRLEGVQSLEELKAWSGYAGGAAR